MGTSTRLTCSNLFEFVNRITIHSLQYTSLSSDLPLHVCAICEQFVGKVTVENYACSSEVSEKRDAGGQLVDKKDVVSFRSRSEKMCNEVELACIGE